MRDLIHGHSAFDRRAVLLGGLATSQVLAFGSLSSPASATDLAAGSPAPTFKCPAADGAIVKLEQFLGRPVVIEWTNPDCPYVKKHYDTANMQRLQADAIAGGAAWLVVTSAPKGKQGYMSAVEALDWLERQKARPTALLMDHEGALADAYGVGLALHMFVVDAAGKLAYQGAIDDAPTARRADVAGARNFVRAALKSIADGQAPSPAITRPYGCRAR